MSHARTHDCLDCRHFNGRPGDLEAAMPGLASLSSAYAAVRSQDGLCALHDRYVAATSKCAAHERRAPVTASQPAPSNRKRWVLCPYP